MEIIILPLFAYCVGSVSSAIIVCKTMGLSDPRTLGSRNPGATNVLRIGGRKAAAITLFGDVLKGFLPVLAAKFTTDSATIIAVVGGAAFLGHLFPLFFGFKGGKGVAAALGVFAGTSPAVTLILVSVWLAVAVIFRYSSVAALTAAACAPVLVLWLLPEMAYFFLALFIGTLLFWRHRANISRFMAGNENKIQL